MIQEIITYIIIGVAILVGIQKFNKKFSIKKKDSDVQKKTTSDPNRCADCTADCLLRDSVNSLNGTDSNYCEKRR